MDNKDRNKVRDIDDNTNLEYIILNDGKFKYPDIVYISTAIDLRPNDDIYNAHGITLMSHRSWGLTVARDTVYFGKPIELPPVYVQKTDPNDDEDKSVVHGSYWLRGKFLYRYEDQPDRENGTLGWQPTSISKNGVMFYDINNHRCIIRKNMVWHEVLTSEIKIDG